MRINIIFKVLIISLINFNFFYLPELSAQCTLQVFPTQLSNECQSGSDGSVSAVGIFGTQPYSAVWRNSGGVVVATQTGLVQGQAAITSGIVAGTYTVTFTDATGFCQRSGNATISNTQFDITTTTNGNTISSNAISATYQWLDCNNGMSIISGENNSSFTPVSNGNYAVQVTKSGCVDTSDCVSIATLSIDETSVFNNVVIYQDNHDMLNIKLGTLNNVSIKVSNINGQIIYSRKNINSTLYKLELNKPTGIYFIEIKSNNRSHVFKFFIK